MTKCGASKWGITSFNKCVGGKSLKKEKKIKAMLLLACEHTGLALP